MLWCVLCRHYFWCFDVNYVLLYINVQNFQWLNINFKAASFLFTWHSFQDSTKKCLLSSRDETVTKTTSLNFFLKNSYTKTSQYFYRNRKEDFYHDKLTYSLKWHFSTKISVLNKNTKQYISLFLLSSEKHKS